MPEGEPGTVSAAAVAKDMLHSFPNVRICLMVGIGGGVPSKRHDIRLGDVVVSAPRDGAGGVFQYDFGKTIQGRAFQQTGFLNKPPTVLLTAVTGIRARYEIQPHQIAETIENILNKHKQLRKRYGRPEPNSDRLYHAGFAHTDGEANCTESCGDDSSILITRTQRGEFDENPAIHYGLIASGNQMMEDASIRDELAKERDILCFEMEAAGLMNHFPCLVIRGICDYADSHKNKEWQGYAAMTATAYAKDLLSLITPKQIKKIQLDEQEIEVNGFIEDLTLAYNLVAPTTHQRSGF